MGKFVIGILVSAVICVLAGAPALCYARGLDDLASSALNHMRNFQRDMASAEAVLKAKSPEAWTPKELEDYLFNALFTIYNAAQSYDLTNRHAPTSCEELRNSGLLTPWPGNPLNNWEPIKWDSANAEFSPGDLVMQICGPEFYSFPKHPTPMSFEISINGTTKEYNPINPITYVPPTWAVVPPGTAFMAGFYVEPASKTTKKREAEKKAKQESKK